ncbi:MAG: RNA methyltransferase [Betaproteobacteria bacterium]|jgi:RNA methyltransferase, TrmH family, group 1|nr:RNA methyltransferase [Betaproteobacteria bacterium]
MFDHFRFVLCHTTHPGNIGATARALKTMGFSRLVLVQPRHFPSDEATVRASGADDLLQQATLCTTLDEALQGTTLAVGLTARRRDLSHPMLTLRDMAVNAPLEASGAGEVALVFGTEMSGLSNAELDLCQRLVHIPTDPTFSSLNLASAVQLVAYELRQTLLQDATQLPQTREYPLAHHEELEQFYRHLERVLLASTFLDPQHPGRLMTRLRRLFSRARIEREEVNILRGILKSLYPADNGSDPVDTRTASHV